MSRHAYYTLGSSMSLLKKRIAQHSATIIAIAAGLICYIIFFNFLAQSTRITPLNTPVNFPEPCPADPYRAPHWLNNFDRPAFGSFVSPEEEAEWSFERIQEGVKRTKGFYTRDYSLWLGWNNVRYIIEAGLLQARLLNRALIIPSFIYTRACEHDIHVCAAYAEMINRGDELESDEWRELPLDLQMGWRIPINLMLDLTRMRRHHMVVTTTEFLRIQNLSPQLEKRNGAWNRKINRQHHPFLPTIHYIPNSDYDSRDTLRVDRLPNSASQALPVNYRRAEGLTELLSNHSQDHVLDMIDGEQMLEKKGLKTWNDWAGFETVLWEHGWTVLETFHPAGPTQWMQTVVYPKTELASRKILRGWVDDYDGVTADVLVLDGETHTHRKPGQMRFTSARARDDFADLILNGVQPSPSIRALGDRLARRLTAMNNGRMWMAGHMRRGDFVKLGWAMAKTLPQHVALIQNGLSAGRAELGRLRDAGIPMQRVDSSQDEVFPNASLPFENDKFYLMTDERSSHGLAYIRENGGILIQDLLTPEDRRLIGWPIMISDVLATLEQTLASYAAYFYAQSVSSVAGGVVNMRAARGFDVRTSYVG